MWRGVAKGFAGIKFSGSPKMFGVNRAINIRENIKIRKPTESFAE
jgi:hypothetical protein